MFERLPSAESNGYTEPAEREAFKDGLSAGRFWGGIKVISAMAAERTIEQEQARYDKMTGAFTETALIEEIRTDLQANPDKPRGLFFIDLGNFKKANKRSQDEGDQVLHQFGTRLRRLTDKFGRASDKADEFLVYVDLESRGGDRTPRETLDFEIQRLREARDVLIAHHPHLDEGKVRLFVGIGGVIYDKNKSYEENRRLANNEMIIAKALGHLEYGQYRTEED